MGLYIDTPTPTVQDAKAFADTHVIIAKKDLARIRAFAKRRGLLSAIRRLKIDVFPLKVG